METLRVVNNRDELERKEKEAAALQRVIERKGQVDAAEALLALTDRGRVAIGTLQANDDF